MLGKCVVVLLDWLLVSEVIAGASVPASSCPQWEMKTKKQRRLDCVLQSFLVGVGGGESLLNV